MVHARPGPAPHAAKRHILTLARKARAFRSLDKLTLTHGGHGLLYGAALVLAAAATAWARHTDTALENLTATPIR